MQDWLCPGSASTTQQPTKAKRKLYCGEHASLMLLLLLLLLPEKEVSDVCMVRALDCESV